MNNGEEMATAASQQTAMNNCACGMVQGTRSGVTMLRYRSTAIRHRQYVEISTGIEQVIYLVILHH